MRPVGLLEAKLVNLSMQLLSTALTLRDLTVMLNLELFGFCFVRSEIWNISL
jgi:hypothetical protein